LAPIVLLLLAVSLSGFLESPGDFHSPYVSPIFFRSYNTVLLSYVLILASFWICSLEVFLTKKNLIVFLLDTAAFPLDVTPFQLWALSSCPAMHLPMLISEPLGLSSSN
jgi:hypothetical protein